MIVGLLLAAQTVTVSVPRAQSAGVYVRTLSDAPDVSESAMLAAACAAVEEETALSARVVDASSCAGEVTLGCVVASARLSSPPPEVVVVGSVRRGAGSASASLFFLHLDRAAAGATEEELFSSGRLDETRFEGGPDAAAMKRWIARTVAGRLGADYRPPGAVQVEKPAELPGVAIDGRVVATTTSTAVLVADVPTGRRLVAAFDANRRSEVAVEVAPGGVTTASLALPPAEPTLLRDVTSYAGIGIAVAGTAVLATALLAPRERYYASCPPGACEPSTFLSTCDLFDPGPHCLDRSSVLVAPLGYGLVLGGAILTAAALLFDDELAYWLAWPAAVLAAGVSYGVSAAAD